LETLRDRQFVHARVNDPKFAYNPLRFTPQGERIDVGVYRQAEQAILQIEGTGATDMGRILEPFFRAVSA
jgi:signal transduction histidine kinase